MNAWARICLWLCLVICAFVCLGCVPQVSIIRDGQVSCGGALISPVEVFAAAHCVKLNEEQAVRNWGGRDLSFTVVRFDQRKDIAVLRLDEPVLSFSYAKYLPVSTNLGETANIFTTCMHHPRQWIQAQSVGIGFYYDYGNVIHSYGPLWQGVNRGYVCMGDSSDPMWLTDEQNFVLHFSNEDLNPLPPVLGRGWAHIFETRYFRGVVSVSPNWITWYSTGED